MNLGAILHVIGKYNEAEESYLKALGLKPSDDVTLLNLKKLRQLQSRRATHFPKSSASTSTGTSANSGERTSSSACQQQQQRPTKKKAKK